MRDKHRKTPATRRTPPGGAAGDSGYRQGQGTSPHGGSSLSLRSMTSLQGEHNPYGRFLSNEDEDEMQIDYSGKRSNGVMINAPVTGVFMFSCTRITLCFRLGNKMKKQLIRETMSFVKYSDIYKILSIHLF